MPRRGTPDEPLSGAVGVALVLALLSGVAALVGEIAGLPALAGVGLMGVVVTAAAAALLVTRASRRSGTGWMRSLWFGVRAMFRWVFEFLPPMCRSLLRCDVSSTVTRALPIS